MKDINDKNVRRDLVVRYLETSTSLEEEQLLADYYSHNEADEDEKAIAYMIALERSNAHLFSDENEQEFKQINRLMEQQKKSPFIRWIIGIGSVAAAIAIFLVLNVVNIIPQKSDVQFGVVEIAQDIQQIMRLELNEIASITATPLDNCVLLNVALEDGTIKMFVMSREEGVEGTSLLAIN